MLRTYYYDTNPLDPTGMFSQYALGRLTAVQYPQFATNVQMNDMYSYSRAGLPAAKRLQVNQLVAYDDINNHLQHQTVTVNLDSTYTYNDEGQATAMTYPSTIGVLNVVTSGASYNYSYDSMNRLGGMTDSNNNTIVSGVSYDAANRLLTMAFSNVNENRNYNVLGQLTQIWAPNVENILYNYPTGTNNGKVSSMYNAVSGETVTYAYDSLNRMATASGSGWAETYTLDPYGNLTTKQVTSGSGPSLSVSVNPGNNQLQGYGFNYDANGNAINSSSATPLAYDAENRLTGVGWNNQAPAVDYCYDAQNKRIFLWTAGTLDSFSNVYNYSVVFYSPSGQKLGTYLLAPQQPVFQPNGINTPYVTVSRVSSDQYFGGRRLAAMDQLGSAGTYYPWGEAKGTTNPQDTWSYATYWRDSATGLDYANNRYYSNAYGRFMTPDPYQASGGPSDPGSWNRYAYTVGDPVNRVDPTGLDYCVDPDCTGGGGGDDPTGYCSPSIESCAPFPGGGGTGGGGGGTGGFVPPVTLGEGAGLLNLQLGGAITGWMDTATGIDLGITAADWELISGICVAQPEVCGLVAGGGLAIYVSYKYGPAVIQSIEAAIESRGKQNVADNGVLEEAYGIMQEAKLKGQQLDICGALAQLANMAAGDTQKLQKIKKTEKQFNCRPSRQSPNR